MLSKRARFGKRIRSSRSAVEQKHEDHRISCIIVIFIIDPDSCLDGIITLLHNFATCMTLGSFLSFNNKRSLTAIAIQNLLNNIQDRLASQILLRKEESTQNRHVILQSLLSITSSCGLERNQPALPVFYSTTPLFQVLLRFAYKKTRGSLSLCQQFVIIRFGWNSFIIAICTPFIYFHEEVGQHSAKAIK